MTIRGSKRTIGHTLFMTAPERRSALRYRVKPGSFAYFHALGSQSEAAIRDLSLGGLYIEDPRNEFSEGMELDLELRLGNKSVSLRGVVARAYAGEGFAVRFLEYSSDMKERLEKHLRGLLSFDSS
ncbi:MAG: PilZ domain-containing protein [Acidobacteria bacterium]|nr:PilZ domain-containing protein [Acidobacteriota bacterium]